MLNPISAAFVAASCDKAAWGWPCDAPMEKLRDDFARETDPAKQKAIAEAIQVRVGEIGTHVYLGQWYQPSAHSNKVTGMITAPSTPVFWNVDIK